MKKNIDGIFYLYLHSKLYNFFGRNKVPIKEVKKFLFQWKIPTKIRILIIKEMEIMGLVIKEGRHNLRFVRPKFNEDEISKYYKILKIF